MSADLNGSEDTAYETEFAAALSAAGEAYRIEPTALIASGAAHGSRLRRRRRAGLLAGAAALALVGTGAATFGDTLIGSGSGSGTGTITAAAAPSAPSVPPVSGEEFLAKLKALLPAGTVDVGTTGEARGTESGTPQARFTFDDGRGQAQILFWVMHTADVVAPAPGCPEARVLAAGGDTCTDTILADGSQLIVYQAGSRADEPAGSKTWSAQLYSKSGYNLMIQEWNRKPLDRGTPVTRTDPPLTTQQLAAVATDPRWVKVAEAIPPLFPPKPKGSAVPTPPGPGETPAKPTAPTPPGPGETPAKPTVPTPPGPGETPAKPTAPTPPGEGVPPVKPGTPATESAAVAAAAQAAQR